MVSDIRTHCGPIFAFIKPNVEYEVLEGYPSAAVPATYIYCHSKQLVGHNAGSVVGAVDKRSPSTSVTRVRFLYSPYLVPRSPTARVRSGYEISTRRLMCGLSLLLVLALVSRVFIRLLRFPSLQKKRTLPIRSGRQGLH